MKPSPPPPGDASAIDAKRARKRSRYLSPPYTDTDDSAAVQAVDDDAGEEEQEPPPDVCAAADVLSALRDAALLSLRPSTSPPFRFLALYMRRRSLASPPLLHFPDFAPAPAPGAGDKPLPSLATGPPATPASAPGFRKKKDQKQKPQQSIPVHFVANAANDSAGSSPPKKRRKSKKMTKSNTGHQHFGNPVALVLDFAQGTPLPSREDLLSTFCKYGFVIQSETAVDKDHRSARVVFATRAEAEVAYSHSCAETTLLGAFGPPLPKTRLQNLPPITLNASLPVPKIPLKDVRKNLEKMILSLTGRATSFKVVPAARDAKLAMGNLVGEMQVLLAKVDKMLHDAASSVHHH